MEEDYENAFLWTAPNSKRNSPEANPSNDAYSYTVNASVHRRPPAVANAHIPGVEQRLDDRSYADGGARSSPSDDDTTRASESYEYVPTSIKRIAPSAVSDVDSPEYLVVSEDNGGPASPPPRAHGRPDTTGYVTADRDDVPAPKGHGGGKPHGYVNVPSVTEEETDMSRCDEPPTNRPSRPSYLSEERTSIVSVDQNMQNEKEGDYVPMNKLVKDKQTSEKQQDVPVDVYHREDVSGTPKAKPRFPDRVDMQDDDPQPSPPDDDVTPTNVYDTKPSNISLTSSINHGFDPDEDITITTDDLYENHEQTSKKATTLPFQPPENHEPTSKKATTLPFQPADPKSVTLTLDPSPVNGRPESSVNDSRQSEVILLPVSPTPDSSGASCCRKHKWKILITVVILAVAVIAVVVAVVLTNGNNGSPEPEKTTEYIQEVTSTMKKDITTETTTTEENTSAPTSDNYLSTTV